MKDDAMTQEFKVREKGIGGVPLVVVLRGLLLSLGLLALLGSSFIHLKLFLSGYRSIFVIGYMFLGQSVVGLALVLVLVLRRRMLWLVLSATFLVGTAAALLISINFGLFGFKDSLSAPYAQASFFVEIVGGIALAVASWLYRSKTTTLY